MTTRSIKLKLIVPRGSSTAAAKVRVGIWETHTFTNGAVRHYERLLLELRQGAVCLGQDEEGRDLIEESEVWAGRLRERLASRGLQPPGIERAMPLLRALYERMVASSVKPNTGAGQDGRAFHSLLVDPTSKSGEAKTARLHLLRPLLAHLGDDLGFDEAARRLVADAGDQLLRSTGAPPGWVRLYKKDPVAAAWVERLHKQVRDDQDNGAFEPGIDQRLRDLGAMPLLDPYGQGLLDSRAALTTVERSAFEQAIEHMNAWESWCRRAQTQYEARKEKHDTLLAQVEATAADSLARMRVYEEARTAHLATLGELGAAPRYTVRLREIRSWPALREWLLDHPEANPEQRTEHLATMQAKSPRGFGGPELLAWLASSDQRDLVEHSAGDVVTQIAALNVYRSVLDRTRRHPTFTFADPVLHPRSMKFGKSGDGNSPAYSLRAEGASRQVRVELLVRGEDGLLHSTHIDLPFAPTRQMQDLTAEGLNLRYARQDGTGWTEAQLQGGNLLLDRRHLARTVRPGPDSLGSVWIKVAVDLASAASTASLKAHLPVRTYLSTAVAGRTAKAGGKKEPPGDGFRILSVDLGLRAAATATVFRVGTPELGGRRLPLSGPAGRVLSAFHERTVTLSLPGEKPDKATLARREAMFRELQRLRGGLGALWALRRASAAQEPEDRVATLGGLEGRVDDDPWISLAVRERLEGMAAGDGSVWLRACSEEYALVEENLGKAISAWRKAERQRVPVGPLGGKSAWAVAHLERSFKLLRSWDRRQRPHDEKVRRPTRGYASRLLGHITALKDDRVKTTADLIVQAACGRAYLGGCWHQQGQKVDLILLEDLSRYRFRSDRPRAENSQLMRWSHRQVADAVRMQAEVEGILVADTGAAFSSRFDAWTGAPGVRCHAMTADDLRGLRDREDYWLRRLLAARLDHLHIDPEKLAPNDLIPTGQGKLLVSLDGWGEPGVRILDADANAAQGLGRRYLEGHAVAFRLPAARVSMDSDEAVAVAELKGKRISSALGGKFVVLRAPTNRKHLGWSAEVFSRAVATRKALGVSAAALKAASATMSDDEAAFDAENQEEAALAEVEEALGVATGERIVFFRDSSGVIARGGWVESAAFWGITQRMVVSRLRKAGRLSG